jgi:heme o synthase
MALVVTARATTGVAAARPRTVALRWFAPMVATWVTGVFALQQVAYVLLPTSMLADALQIATVASFALACALAIVAWLTTRDDGAMLFAATVAPLLIAGQLIGTQLLQTLELATFADVANAALGLLGVGALTWAAVAARSPEHISARRPAAALLRYVLKVTVFVVFAAALSGFNTRAVGASWACDGAVLCRFGDNTLIDMQAYHRLLAYVSVGLIAWVIIEAVRIHGHSRAVRGAAIAVAGTTLAQAGIGFVSVFGGVPPLAQVLHVVGSVAMWMSTVTLAVVAQRHGEMRIARGARRGTFTVLAAYIQLTKPRVMSLLLATTAAAMVIAARGMPPVGVLLATLVGGALMSGGAGAINHYVDRDIDPLMGRTAWRPIPSGVIAPARALWFGIALAVLASAVLLTFVNVLATVFALLGLLGYVFIYTLWLKRSTPSNIVIGGAAGAIPPLVGWAAVTNELSSLTAWYLFAIIFFWTPPHFWALSLLIRKHYERAGVPMLPVVRGEDETRRQIVLYSLVLIALTLVLAPFGLMGAAYFASALLLGGVFILNAVRLWREATPAAARRLYLYSILYLFALFAAMAVDRSL